MRKGQFHLWRKLVSLTAVLSLTALWPEVFVRAERLPLKTYTAADGLPHNAISRVLPDSRGFIWFATAGGLSRFDGRQFVNYGLADGLSFGNVNNLLETRGGVYWIATNGGGVCRFNPAADAPVRFTAYRVGDTAAASRVNTLFEDRAAGLWAGTDGGLFRLDEKAGAFVPVALGISGQADRLIQVWALVEDRQGSLWIATKFGLVQRLPDGRMLTYAVQPSASGDVVFALLLDRVGRLWLGHKTAGVLVFAPETLNCGVRSAECGVLQRAIAAQQMRGTAAIRNYTTADGLGSNDVRVFCETPDGRLWLGTNGGGIAEFDGQRWRSYSKTYDLHNEVVGSLSADRAGNLWIVTVNGVLKLTRDGFVTYREADGLGQHQVIAVFTDRTGALYAISGNWRINRFERERTGSGQFEGGHITSVRLNLPLPDPEWRSFRNILQTQDGEWWAATPNGLFRFAAVARLEQLATARPRAVYTTRDGLLADDVTYLYEDRRGDLWMSTFAPGQEVVARWERTTGRFYRYGAADGLPPFNAVMTFAEDATGALWIGFREGGLARYAGGRFKLFTAAEGAPDSGIRGIVRDDAGRLWIGSLSDGLSCVEDPAAAQPRFTTFTMRDGLSSQSVVTLITDGVGRVYCLTWRGLDRFDPASGRFRHFTAADGLSGGLLYCGARDRQGVLWFGTAQGLVRLIPTPDLPAAPPPVFISGLRVEGEARPLFALGQQSVTGLKLEAQQNHLEIDFFGFTAQGGALRYQTKLEGLAGDWSAPVEQNSVNLRLSPGTYRLLVRAVDANGTASATPATVSFVILPPLWQRSWFLALLLLAACGAGYAFYRYRLRRVLELERVRMRIATELHDDIGTSLSRIALLSEVVKQQTGPLNLRTAQLLNDISDSARAVLDNMSDIVWSIDPRRDDVEHVVARIRQFAADVLGARRIAWELQVAPEVEQLRLKPEPRRQLYLIFKEALNNIAKHAHCRAVTLGLATADRQLSVVIHDDGCGFKVPAPDEFATNGFGGHGLASMRARAEQVGGQFFIESAPGHGTRIILCIPLSKVAA